MHREIATLEEQLQELRDASGAQRRGPGAPRRGTAPRLPIRGAAPAAAAAGRKRGRRRRTAPITAEQLASRQLQGRYLGLIRQIPANKRAQYQKTARDKGREAAIKDMQSALKK